LCPLFSAAAAAHPSGFLFLCSFQKIGGLGYFAAYASYPDVHDCVGQTDGLWIRMLVCCPSCFLLIIILIVVMGCSCLLEESNGRIFRIIILFATALPDNALQFLIPVHELLHSPLQLPMILPNLLTTKLFALFIWKKRLLAR
jgi:hypothetical protein